MKKFSKHINEQLGFEIDKPDNRVVKFGDIEFTLHSVDQSGWTQKRLIALPVNDKDKTPGDALRYVLTWNDKSINSLITELKKRNIKYAINPSGYNLDYDENVIHFLIDDISVILGTYFKTFYE